MISVNEKPVELKTFPNGETRLDLLQFNWLDEGDRVTIDLDYRDDSDLIHLMMMKKSIDNSGARFESVNLSIGYMPYSRMDRQTTDAFTLKYVANFINDLHFDNVEVSEPHSDVAVALLDRVYPLYPSADWLLRRALLDIEFDREWDRILFPDAGAQKRYSALEGFKTMTATKHRDAEGNLSKCKIDGGKGDYSKVVIIDDLCSYGGTFLNVAKGLCDMREGWGMICPDIYLVVTHLERSVYLGDMIDSGLIKGIYCTNSLHDAPEHAIVKMYDLRTAKEITQ